MTARRTTGRIAANQQLGDAVDAKKVKMIQSIQSAMQAARDAGDAMVEYLLETALAEALRPEREEITQAHQKAVPGSRSMH